MEPTMCPECNEPIEKVCYECGCFYDVPEFVAHDLYNYYKRTKRVYNRMDHFKEVLSQFQGREGKQIPPGIMDLIKAQIKVPEEASMDHLKLAIKKLKLTSYMENLNSILGAITGEEPPYIPRVVEEKLIRMFKGIDRVYTEVQRDERKSFLNYNYILFKLLESEGEFALLPRVPLLRTRLRLRQHDTVWKQMCDKLGWAFQKTDTPYKGRPFLRGKK